ncbi:PDZ domain-containing protein [Microbacterium bovistercoris]|uniref:PDZ domain-containing protein n=1 Tax=Microbacterium bovistercoris TaxID=2293570 RepID=A0A371NWR6_9MICO|nr:trypsin-like peptidase domain-containing protein [Microbacterium bovistercoris]REJ07605.1 PDZ domain-containing protein [Microbacterium bovistercoris]
MNENNQGEPIAPQPSQNPDAAGAPAGHQLPSSFSSDSQAPAAAAPAAAAPQIPVTPQTPAAQDQAFPAPHSPAPQATAPQPQAPAGQGFAAPGAASQQPGAAYATGAAFGLPPQSADAPTQPVQPLQGAQPTAPAKRSGGKIAAFVLAAALVGGVAGFGGGALWSSAVPESQGSAESGPQTVTVNNPGSVNETTAIATKVLPSVVTIDVSSGNEGGSGSGVVLTKDGYVLTNTHVVTLGGAASDPAIRVTTSDGKIYDATIVGTDPIYDLAVIKLEDAKGLKPIDFADSSKLNVGDTAVAVGAPLGLSNSVTTGIVSALNRSIQIASSAAPETGDQNQGEQEENGGSPFQFDIPGQGQQQQASESISIAVIQTDAAINPGNSGGALVDSKGDLIGINVAIATAGGSSSGGSESGSIGLGFSIPSDVAQRVAKQIMEDGAATHGLLGASVRDAASVEGSTVAGAYIVETTPGGAAAKAGLQKGDIVTEFNGVPITNSTDLTAQVRAAAGGSDGKLSYVRDGKSYDAEVTLGTLKP